MGLLTPAGIGVESTWKAVCAGQSGIGPITYFDTTGFSCRIAGELKGFDPLDFIEKKEIKKMGKFIHYAVAAAQMAVDDAGLKITAGNRDRVGVYVGSGMGGLPSIEEYHKAYMEKGPRKISPFFVPMVIINLASGQVAIRFGARGPNSAAVSACATGTHCIGDSYHIIARGDADAMIVGGAEAVISPMGVGGFASMKALSTRNDSPTTASRPFSVDRDGFVMGEGAGVLILEALEVAQARGAKIYGEIIGYGMNGDAYHITAPSLNGEGAARCIKLAIDSAGISPDEIDYINAHATSTGADATETMAIKSVFGEKAYDIKISSTKSITGHLLGASGAVEAIFSIMAINTGIVPPTINLDNPDPECDLNYVPNKAVKKDVNTALSNSFGFGGTNAALVIRKFAQ